MTDKQLLTKYQTERTSLQRQRDRLDDRLQALDGVIDGLRVLTGEAPAQTRASKAGKATGSG